ncbi:TlpA family protein disulfide reductase [Sphingobacterium sp. SGR-19]|uniref:TlpA family protein disulfide reductase n=1 Tax=Sphingobacterium sp. SGR-19 TaxID=2710886 RepID=UPI0013EA1AE9|nr:TlpA disulfide reductase family protein [Sphingobacterium sp. SGR-19]NGM67324.1 TlpA family protein disulfide reductase [Sphingobacterium sp. SGR-19]
MKCLITSFWLTVCCCLLFIETQGKPETDSLTAVIDIVIHDQGLLKDAVLEFELYKDGISSRYIKDRQYSRTELVDSITRFTIPLSTAINYGRIVFTSGELREGKSPVNLNYRNNLFLFEHGDTIQVHLYPKKIRNVAFSGNRANKYTALYEVSNKKVLDTQTNNRINDLEERNEIGAIFEVMQVWADSLNRVLDLILSGAGHSLNPQIRERVLFDNSAFTYKVMRTKMDRLVRTKTDDVKVLQLIHSFLSQRAFEHRSMLNEPVAASSYGWCDMLLTNERLRNKVKYILANESTSNGESIGKALSERYIGNVRSKLFYLAMLANLDADGTIRNSLQDKLDNTDLYWEGARAFVARSEGSPAFNFEMVDVDGVTHRLRDYKGKVVIIDFWFSGCIACMYLTKEMHEAVKFYENSDDVVFVSLNFDRYPDFWKRSLASGKYTHESGVNLWSGETAINHPIIGHYGIQSFPSLYIVDKDGLLVEKGVNGLFTKEDPSATDKFKALVDQYR